MDPPLSRDIPCGKCRHCAHLLPCDRCECVAPIPGAPDETMNLLNKSGPDAVVEHHAGA